ncbi:MAG: PTS sugar transporter subunit IIA [Culicoidibacterales bacterium]
MLSLNESLKAENSIRLQLVAATWQEAIMLAVEPLITSGAVEQRYADAIIESTIKSGPYYILCPGMAMPHARPEDGVQRNAFSLITLKEPVIFAGGQEVSVLVSLAATSSEIHLGKAIPQIIALFEITNIFEQLSKSRTEEDIYALIEQTKQSKYLTAFK